MSSAAPEIPADLQAQSPLVIRISVVKNCPQRQDTCCSVGGTLVLGCSHRCSRSVGGEARSWVLCTGHELGKELCYTEMARCLSILHISKADFFETLLVGKVSSSLTRIAMLMQENFSLAFLIPAGVGWACLWKSGTGSPVYLVHTFMLEAIMMYGLSRGKWGCL